MPRNNWKVNAVYVVGLQCQITDVFGLKIKSASTVFLQCQIIDIVGLKLYTCIYSLICAEAIVLKCIQLITNRKILQLLKRKIQDIYIYKRTRCYQNNKAFNRLNMYAFLSFYHQSNRSKQKYTLCIKYSNYRC